MLDIFRMCNTLGITLIHFVNRACLDVALMEKFYSVRRRRLCVRPLIVALTLRSLYMCVGARTVRIGSCIYACSVTFHHDDGSSTAKEVPGRRMKWIMRLV